MLLLLVVLCHHRWSPCRLRLLAASWACAKTPFLLRKGAIRQIGSWLLRPALAESEGVEHRLHLHPLQLRSKSQKQLRLIRLAPSFTSSDLSRRPWCARAFLRTASRLRRE